MTGHWKPKTYWESSLKLITLITQEVAWEISVNHSIVIQLLIQLEVESLISVCHISWQQIKTQLPLWRYFPDLFLCNNKETFLNRIVTLGMKVDFSTTISNSWLSDWTEKKVFQSTFQSQTCTRIKVVVTVLCLIHYSFWILVKTHWIWEVYSATEWVPANCKAYIQHFRQQ